MNDINEMPPKCQYCPYWEICEYPWVCPDREQLANKLQPTCSATDTISRQSALNVLNKLDVSDGVGISSIACCLQEEAIRNLYSRDIMDVCDYSELFRPYGYCKAVFLDRQCWQERFCEYHQSGCGMDAIT